ncbi:C1QL [Mytilus coruscus]|uniref:C1QL n=1 Tax=Mytilus coruscus TaxID=42192 RepID=A0A6J8CND2_MYTCO|nr:C1QL [Mytilus coruscus]
MAWYIIILCLFLNGIIATRNDINLENLLKRMENYEKKIVKLEMEVQKMSVIEKEAAELRKIVQGNSRPQRFLLDEGPGVAFSAYKSASFDAPSFGVKHTLIYDLVECNVGNGYENFTGIFRASAPGTYAFTWTVCASGDVNSEIGVELVIDSKVHGSIYVDSETHGEEHCSTGFVIHTIKTGDVVYTRSQGAGHEGTIRSDQYTRTTFSGWLLFY